MLVALVAQAHLIVGLYKAVAAAEHPCLTQRLPQVVRVEPERAELITIQVVAERLLVAQLALAVVAAQVVAVTVATAQELQVVTAVQQEMALLLQVVRAAQELTPERVAQEPPRVVAQARLLLVVRVRLVALSFIGMPQTPSIILVVQATGKHPQAYQV